MNLKRGGLLVEWIRASRDDCAMDGVVADATENLNALESGVPVGGCESTDRARGQEEDFRGKHHGTREVDDPEGQRESGFVQQERIGTVEGQR